MAEGLSNRAISERLTLSEKTVQRPLANIFLKPDVTTHAAAGTYVFRQGCIGTMNDEGGSPYASVSQACRRHRSSFIVRLASACLWSRTSVPMRVL